MGTSQTADESERAQAAPRWRELFECPAGHEFEVQFAHDADLPDTWECRHHGRESQWFAVPPQLKHVKPTRTHRDMLIERRSIEELEVLLDDALQKLRLDDKSRRESLTQLVASPIGRQAFSAL